MEAAAAWSEQERFQDCVGHSDYGYYKLYASDVGITGKGLRHENEGKLQNHRPFVFKKKRELILNLFNLTPDVNK